MIVAQVHSCHVQCIYVQSLRGPSITMLRFRWTRPVTTRKPKHGSLVSWRRIFASPYAPSMSGLIRANLKGIESSMATSRMMSLFDKFFGQHGQPESESTVPDFFVPADMVVVSRNRWNEVVTMAGKAYEYEANLHQQHVRADDEVFFSDGRDGSDAQGSDPAGNAAPDMDGVVLAELLGAVPPSDVTPRDHHQVTSQSPVPAAPSITYGGKLTQYCDLCGQDFEFIGNPIIAKKNHRARKCPARKQVS